jgi:alpha-L-fucosidase
MAGTVVPSQLLSNGSLEITVSDDVVSADQYSWVFKISYGGQQPSGTSGAAPSASSVVPSTGGASLSNIPRLNQAFAVLAAMCIWLFV